MNDDSVSPEPLDQFKTFLKSYIEENDISNSINTQIDVLLEVRSMNRSHVSLSLHISLIFSSIVLPQA